MQPAVVMRACARVAAPVCAAMGRGQAHKRALYKGSPAMKMVRHLNAASAGEGGEVMRPGEGGRKLQRQRQNRQGGMGRMMSPFRLMQDMEQEMNDLMKGFGLTHLSDSPMVKHDMSLAVDIEETKDSYMISADIPGMKASDIKVDVSPDHVLTIVGERKSEEKSEEGGVVRMERSYGTFGRSFRLPDHVDIHGIKAEASRGVLKLHVPKVEEEKVEPKTIAINVSDSE